jgi:hypothetical protein
VLAKAPSATVTAYVLLLPIDSGCEAAARHVVRMEVLCASVFEQSQDHGLHIGAPHDFGIDHHAC